MCKQKPLMTLDLVVRLRNSMNVTNYCYGIVSSITTVLNFKSPMYGSSFEVFIDSKTDKRIPNSRCRCLHKVTKLIRSDKNFDQKCIKIIIK